MGCVPLEFCSIRIKFWQNLIAFFQRKVMIAAWMNQHRPRWVFSFFKICKGITFFVTGHLQIFKSTADEPEGSLSPMLFCIRTIKGSLVISISNSSCVRIRAKCPLHLRFFRSALPHQHSPLSFSHHRSRAMYRLIVSQRLNKVTNLWIGDRN